MAVWIVKASGHNYEKALKYGELQIILGEEVSPFNLDRASSLIEESLLRAQKDDYVIIVGPPILNMLLMKYWPYPEMKILLFHARTKEYVYRELIL